ncbi:hypothetical protein SLS58_003136 [Diplodia intermedia]|uniref:Uncharacterized protein n=1 Tax=Diplodia intermedia TaxID=856260 RepID=A0ABR3TX20_9PEZI
MSGQKESIELIKDTGRKIVFVEDKQAGIFSDVWGLTVDALVATRTEASAVSTYQHHFLNVFVYEKAKRIREKHLDDTLSDDILEWTVNERFVVFEDLWDEDPRVLAWLMWHPFTHPIDFDSIFFPPEKATTE